MSAKKLLLRPQKMKNHSQQLFNLPSCSSGETAVPDTGVTIFWCTLNENTEFEIKTS